MKAFLIDPFATDPAKIVTEIDYEPGLAGIYKALSHETHPVDMIEAVYPYETDDCIYVDEEGLFKSTSQGWFRVAGWASPIRGRGLVVGTDADGNTIAPEISIELVRASVTLWEL